MGGGGCIGVLGWGRKERMIRKREIKLVDKNKGITIIIIIIVWGRLIWGFRVF